MGCLKRGCVCLCVMGRELRGENRWRGAAAPVPVRPTPPALPQRAHLRASTWRSGRRPLVRRPGTSWPETPACSQRCAVGGGAGGAANTNASPSGVSFAGRGSVNRNEDWRANGQRDGAEDAAEPAGAVSDAVAGGNACADTRRAWARVRWEEEAMRPRGVTSSERRHLRAGRMRGAFSIVNAVRCVCARAWE